MQEGAIGLLTAVDEYDPARGTSFSTYAFWRVRAAVTHAVTARGSLVRIPRPLLERRRQVRAARDLLTETGHEPSVSELATATSLPVAAVVEALAPSNVVSLDQPLADGTPLGDHIAGSEGAQPDARAVSAQERRITARRAAPTAPPQAGNRQAPLRDRRHTRDAGRDRRLTSTCPPSGHARSRTRRCASWLPI